MYSVKSVSSLTGLSADTLRAWERRYGAVIPLRDENQRRIYGPDDVVRLRLLSSVVNLGNPIGRLVNLDNDQLRQYLKESQLGEPKAEETQCLISQLIESAKEYRSDLIDEALGLALTSMSPLEAARDILAPTLREIGEKWHRHEINVAQEHLLSSSIERRLVSVINIYQKQRAGPKVLFTTLTGEPHAFGILLSAYIAASHRLNCYYFGPNLPVDEIIVSAKQINAKVVTLSMVYQPLEKDRVADLWRLCEAMDSLSQVWVGGKAAEALSKNEIPPNCAILRNLDEFQDRIKFL